MPCLARDLSDRPRFLRLLLTVATLVPTYQESFAQHISGKAHASRCGGRKGFAGLLPNAMGVIPALVRADLRMASAQFGTDPDGSGGGAHNGTSVAWAPPVRQISLSYEVEHALP